MTPFTSHAWIKPPLTEFSLLGWVLVSPLKDPRNDGLSRSSKLYIVKWSSAERHTLFSTRVRAVDSRMSYMQYEWGGGVLISQVVAGEAIQDACVLFVEMFSHDGVEGLIEHRGPRHLPGVLTEDLGDDFWSWQA